MRDGWIKAAAGTPAVSVAGCAENGAACLSLAREAAGAGAQLLVLPELCLTGYTCGDLFSQRTLTDAAAAALLFLAQQTAGLPLLIAAGLPSVQGGKLYNCAAVLYRGEILGLIPKTYLPNYGEFYEARQFTPADTELPRTAQLCGREIPFGTDLLFCCREAPEFVLGVEICEDLWSIRPPSIRMAEAGASIIANLSASDETAGKVQYRRNLVCGQSARLVCGYVYAGAGDGESTTDMVFAGHRLIAENGVLLAESGLFSSGLTVSEIDVQRLYGERQRMSTYPAAGDTMRRIPFSLPLSETKLTRFVSSAPFLPAEGPQRAGRCEEILSIQAHGLATRLLRAGAKKAVIGVSGGLDSSLALLAAARAMDFLSRPRTDILAITMPCFGTTSRTLENARGLCRALGVSLREIPLGKAVRGHLRDIGHDEAIHDVTYENAQARERTQVLMDAANQAGGIVVGTGDLSELALGWATYNGDHMSMYGVNASVPKTLVRYLVLHEAEREPSLSAVLRDILDTPVSPELLPADGDAILQRTEDLVGPYALHDFFLYYVIRWGFPPRKVLRLAVYAFGDSFGQEEILRWLRVFYRRFFAQQFKRSCLPDGPKVGSVSLSPRGDWRMPSDASAALWLRELDEPEGTDPGSPAC